MTIRIIDPETVTTCANCGEPIFPGDLAFEAADGSLCCDPECTMCYDTAGTPLNLLAHGYLTALELGAAS